MADCCDLMLSQFLRHSENRNYDEKFLMSIRTPEHTQSVDMHVRDAAHLALETIDSVFGIFSRENLKNEIRFNKRRESLTKVPCIKKNERKYDE